MTQWHMVPGSLTCQDKQPEVGVHRVYPETHAHPDPGASPQSRANCTSPHPSSPTQLQGTLPPSTFLIIFPGASETMMSEPCGPSGSPHQVQ